MILKEYNGEVAEAVRLIQAFWLAHNDFIETVEGALEDIQSWTDQGHKLYFIEKDGINIGFAHIGSRGVEIDWLEDLFILPEYQGNGYGTAALQLIEEEVKQYSQSIYLEVAARNLSALKLYHRNGYNCLNTVTIRKDFQPENHQVIQDQEILGHQFEIKQQKQS